MLNSDLAGPIWIAAAGGYSWPIHPGARMIVLSKVPCFAARRFDMGWPRFMTPASVLMLAIAGTAAAADNSGIVIIDQQQRSTPFGNARYSAATS